MIAQLTTLGELSFELNALISNSAGTTLSYVASSENLPSGAVVSSLLKYPQACGCIDPNYLEYDPGAGCDDGSCENLIVFGCTDPIACSYNENANFNVPELCCYVGDCEGLDEEFLCASLSVQSEMLEKELKIFPVPFSNELNIINTHEQPLRNIDVYSSTGQRVYQLNQIIYPNEKISISMGGLANGVYIIIGYGDDFAIRKSVLKSE